MRVWNHGSIKLTEIRVRLIHWLQELMLLEQMLGQMWTILATVSFWIEGGGERGMSVYRKKAKN